MNTRQKFDADYLNIRRALVSGLLDISAAKAWMRANSEQAVEAEVKRSMERKQRQSASGADRSIKVLPKDDDDE